MSRPKKMTSSSEDCYSVFIQSSSQIAANAMNDVDKEYLHHCLTHALKTLELEACELTVCIVDENESAKMNSRYRGIDKATNVLSFPCELRDEAGNRLLGDIAVCRTVVEREAATQHKKTMAHYAHLCVHGLLHLLGYNHIETEEAAIMEKLETEILASLGIKDPYVAEKHGVGPDGVGMDAL